MRGNALEDSIMMKKTHFLVRATVIAVVLASLGACAMNRTQRNAGIGAAAGGALGYLITGGPIGTVAGGGPRAPAAEPARCRSGVPGDLARVMCRLRFSTLRRMRDPGRIRPAGRPARVGQQGAPAARPVAVYGVVQEAAGAPRATGDARQAGARPAARRAQTTRLSLSAAIAASP
ncbi:osmosis-related lipoprotein [Burkholderia pseudomallei]|nr:osmosis-related lipoprotein [Burkholderia pseudomallei]CPF08220.1 osmosis-related lipoprotein [Burkholderia pseudomallei]